MTGCLSVSAWRLGESIVCNAYEVSSRIEVSASRVGSGINCKAESLNSVLNISASRLGERLSVSAHHICTVNKASFLNVIPDVIWLSPDELASADFDIISNVKWFIN